MSLTGVPAGKTWPDATPGDTYYQVQSWPDGSPASDHLDAADAHWEADRLRQELQRPFRVVPKTIPPYPSSPSSPSSNTDQKENTA